MPLIQNKLLPFIFLILASIVNIILDFVLILGGKMGVEGAALATVIAQLFSSVCCIFLIWKKMPILWIKKEDFKMPWGYLQRHLNLALPMGFQSSIIAIGSLILQYALNGFGTTAVAAYTAAQKIDSIATMPMCSGFIELAMRAIGALVLSKVLGLTMDAFSVSLAFPTEQIF